MLPCSDEMDAVRNFRTVGKKIVAVARNYRAHAAELNNPVPTAPFFFMKPTTTYLSEGEPIKIPANCTNLAHEVELGVIIGKLARNVPVSEAMEYVGGYTLALDMTARDFQNQAKQAGQPWFLAKGFDGACPISSSMLVRSSLPTFGRNVPLWCKVNGVVRQQGNTNDMIFDIATLIQAITVHVTLEPGDLLLTGTPEGVGQVKNGDTIECGLGQNDQLKMKFDVVQ